MLLKSQSTNMQSCICTHKSAIFPAYIIAVLWNFRPAGLFFFILKKTPFYSFFMPLDWNILIYQFTYIQMMLTSDIRLITTSFRRSWTSRTSRVFSPVVRRRTRTYRGFFIGCISLKIKKNFQLVQILYKYIFFDFSQCVNNFYLNDTYLFYFQPSK